MISLIQLSFFDFDLGIFTVRGAVLHGGPGAGCSDRHARFFDPQHYRIVLFDQRGCGKSTPRGCLEENTTWDLVSDIEQLRQHLGVTKSVLYLPLFTLFSGLTTLENVGFSAFARKALSQCMVW